MNQLLSFLIIFFSCGFSVMGQNNNSHLDGYLSGAWKDQALGQFNGQINYLNEKNYTPSVLKRVELRVGSQDANTSLNQYRLRLGATNPFEIIANKEYHRQEKAHMSTQKDLLLADLLRSRYHRLANLYHQLGLMELYRIQLTSIAVHTKNATLSLTNEVNLNDLVDLHALQSKTMLKLNEVESNLLYLIHQIKNDYPAVGDEPSVPTDLIQPAQIKSYLRREDNLANQNNNQIKEAEEDLKLDLQALKIDRAKANGMLGYVQSNIDTDRGNSLTDRVGLQVGIRIPIVNPDKADMNREKASIIKKKARLDLLKKSITDNAKLYQLKLNKLIERYELLSERLRSAQNINIETGAVNNWKTYLDWQSYLHDLKTEALNIEMDIRLAFIDYLHIQSKLLDNPPANYLSQDFRPLEFE